MLDNLGYGARIHLHTEALKELFLQVKENPLIHIKDIKISTPVEGGDWKDFLLQTLELSGLEEVRGDEDRPFTNKELEALLLREKFENLFSKPLYEAGLLPKIEALKEATIEALREIKNEAD